MSLEKELNKIVKEAVGKLDENSIKKALRDVLNENFSSRYMYENNMFISCEKLIVEEFAKEYVKNNFVDIISMIDTKVIANLVTSKIAQKVRDEAVR